MSSVDNTTITLGGGTLYLNNVNVGALSGDVEFTYKRDKVGFRPNDCLADIKKFAIRETCQLKASLAELKLANLKLAIGDTVAVGSSQSFPAYDPSSYTAVTSSSYDVLTFGGKSCVYETSLRFEHTRPCGTKKVIIILYNAVSMTDLLVGFHEETITLHDLIFEGLSVETRTKGDRIGVVVDEVLQTT